MEDHPERRQFAGSDLQHHVPTAHSAIARIRQAGANQRVRVKGISTTGRRRARKKDPSIGSRLAAPTGSKAGKTVAPGSLLPGLAASLLLQRQLLAAAGLASM